jgi:hypothetical protein
VPDRQSNYVFVRNADQLAKDITVNILAGSKVVATSTGRESLHIEKGSTTLIPSFGFPPPKRSEPLPEAPEGLMLRLRDAVTGQLLDDQVITPSIAFPTDYIEVIDARFIPTHPGEANRLEITFRSLPQMTRPRCRVKLILPSDKELFRAFREQPKGRLEGDLEPGGKTLTLYAEDIKLDPAAKEEGQFQVTIDGHQRALWFKTRFTTQGKPQPATIDRTPRVRFQPELVVKPGQVAKLRIQFAVDNAPADAILIFRLGRNRQGQFVDDISTWSGPAKRWHLGFDPRGEGGALLFEAAVDDWTRDFDVRAIRGSRRLQASLLDADDSKILSAWGMDLVLDDLPPQDVAIEAPAEVTQGTTTLPVKARVTPPASGIKEAAFALVNQDLFEKAEAEGKVVRGKPEGDDQGTWVAILPLNDATGKLTVTVRFTSGVGLSAVSSAELVVREPPPAPAAVSGKPTPEKPGEIEGKVTESDLAQPGLVVFLIDPKAKENENPVKNQTRTAADGTYLFSGLKPGPYRVYCLKQETNRRASKDLTVESGKKIRQDLDLLLP